MDILKIANDVAKKNGRDVQHFSIKKVGSKFYVYAYFNPVHRSIIGRYNSYMQARLAVKNILNIKSALEN